MTDKFVSKQRFVPAADQSNTVSVDGPGHHRLMGLSKKLNMSPTVQRLGAFAPKTKAESTAMSPCNSVVQRVVLSKYYPLIKGGDLICYYSTLDTKLEFEDPALAQEYDDELREEIKEGELDKSRRYPTGYTYRNAERDARNIVPSSDNGPHTLSHSSLSFRLENKFDQANFDKATLTALRDEQVPDVAEFTDLFNAETGAKVKPIQARRAIMDYALVYNRLQHVIDSDGIAANSDQAFELLMRLLQMHPYTAYGKAKPGNKRLGGKGEGKEDPFSEAFDHLAKFDSQENYKAFKETRKSLYPDEDANDYGGMDVEGEDEEEGRSFVDEEQDLPDLFNLEDDAHAISNNSPLPRPEEEKDDLNKRSAKGRKITE